jgi:hypothetical protein
VLPAGKPFFLSTQPRDGLLLRASAVIFEGVFCRAWVFAESRLAPNLFNNIRCFFAGPHAAFLGESPIRRFVNGLAESAEGERDSRLKPLPLLLRWSGRPHGGEEMDV